MWSRLSQVPLPKSLHDSNPYVPHVSHVPGPDRMLHESPDSVLQPCGRSSPVLMVWRNVNPEPAHYALFQACLSDNGDLGGQTRRREDVLALMLSALPYLTIHPFPRVSHGQPMAASDSPICARFRAVEARPWSSASSPLFHHA